MVHAFPLVKLCSRDVTTVKMTYTRGSTRELSVTSAYLPYDSDETLPSEGLRTSLTFVVGINCSSSLDVMPMHTTIFGGAWTSVHEENASWKKKHTHTRTPTHKRACAHTHTHTHTHWLQLSWVGGGDC